jgi:hypothetical protein
MSVNDIKFLTLNPFGQCQVINAKPSMHDKGR